MINDTFELSDPYAKLDLEPLGGYNQEIEALGDILNGEYNSVAGASKVIDPRTSHEIFRQSYHGEDPAIVKESHVEEIINILEENLQDSRTAIGEKLFDLGYRWGEHFIDLGTAIENPYINKTDEKIADKGIVSLNPFTQGKKKREGDKYYHFANGYLVKDMRDWSIEIE